MTTYTTTFSGQTTGANPTNFTNRYDTETAVSVENPSIGESDSRLLQFGTGDSGDIFQSFDDIDGDANRDNIEILGKVRVAGDDYRNTIFRGRASGSSGGTKTCYDAYINTDDFTISRWVNGSGTVLTSTPTETNSPFSHVLGDTFIYLPANTWYWCRLRINGTGATVSIKAKWWLDTWGEPTDWTLEYDDTSASRITAAGWAGIAKRRFSVASYLDAFSAGTNGDTAPSPSTSTARITALSAQVAQDPDPDMRITQLNANVMHSGNPDMRITQLYASVMYSQASTTGSQTIPCIICC